jgi:hypothetical protein
MSSADVQVLLESKQEYTKQFVNVTGKHFVAGLLAMYESVQKRNRVPKMILREYQAQLRLVPQWSQTILEHEETRFLTNTHCDWLEELLKAIFTVNVQIMSNLSSGKPLKTKMCVEVPSLKTFLHRCYINMAREVWKQPRLVYHRIPKMDYQNNMIALTTLVEQCIVDTIRQSLPFRDFLGNVLREESHNDVEEESDKENGRGRRGLDRSSVEESDDESERVHRQSRSRSRSRSIEESDDESDRGRRRSRSRSVEDESDDDDSRSVEDVVDFDDRNSRNSPTRNEDSDDSEEEEPKPLSPRKRPDPVFIDIPMVEPMELEDVMESLDRKVLETTDHCNSTREDVREIKITKPWKGRDFSADEEEKRELERREAERREEEKREEERKRDEEENRRELEKREADKRMEENRREEEDRRKREEEERQREEDRRKRDEEERQREEVERREADRQMEAEKREAEKRQREAERIEEERRDVDRRREEEAERQREENRRREDIREIKITRRGSEKIKKVLGLSMTPEEYKMNKKMVLLRQMDQYQ